MKNLMADIALEIHIADCGTQMAAEYAEYEATGCFGHRGGADGWRMAMHRAIGQRSQAQVARMEKELGLSHA